MKKKNEEGFAIIFKYRNIVIPQREVILTKKNYKDIIYS